MNQREAVATFYAVAAIVGFFAFGLIWLATVITPAALLGFFGLILSLLLLAGLYLIYQANKERISRVQAKTDREKKEKIRETNRKKALFESLQRDSEYLQKLKRARGEKRY